LTFLFLGGHDLLQDVRDSGALYYRLNNNSSTIISC